MYLRPYFVHLWAINYDLVRKKMKNWPTAAMLFRSFVHLFCFGERFSRDPASRNRSREQKIRYITSRDQPGKVWISYNFYMKSKWTVFQASAKQTVKIYSIMQPTFLLSKGVKYDAKLIFIDRLISRKHMSLIATQQQHWHRVPHLHIRSCPSMQMRQLTSWTNH